MQKPKNSAWANSFPQKMEKRVMNRFCNNTDVMFNQNVENELKHLMVICRGLLQMATNTNIERKAAKGMQTINMNVQVHESQNAFLSNGHRKKKLTDPLSKCFISAGYSVSQSKEDADTMIVYTATDMAIIGKNVIVVAYDIDVLFLYNWNLQ